uniref:Uncharacterized protein n=1 Tax=Salmonella phage SalP219 TaxID=3158864 RepID=A0AAU7PK17_9CAUD
MKKALKDIMAVWWSLFAPLAVAYIIAASVIGLLLYISQ